MTFSDWLPVINLAATVIVSSALAALHIKNANAAEIASALTTEVISDVTKLAAAHNTLADHVGAPAATVTLPPDSAKSAALVAPAA